MTPTRSWLTAPEIDARIDAKLEKYDNNLQAKLRKLQEQLDRVEAHGKALFSENEGVPSGYLVRARAEDKTVQLKQDGRLEKIENALKSEHDRAEGRNDMLRKIYVWIKVLSSSGVIGAGAWILHWVFQVKPH